jgi:hypothetical protein
VGRNNARSSVNQCQQKKHMRIVEGTKSRLNAVNHAGFDATTGRRLKTDGIPAPTTGPGGRKELGTSTTDALYLTMEAGAWESSI